MLFFIYLFYLFIYFICFIMQDTRALIVREVYQVEKSYVDSLQFLIIVSIFKEFHYFHYVISFIIMHNC